MSRCGWFGWVGLLCLVLALGACGDDASPGGNAGNNGGGTNNGVTGTNNGTTGTNNGGCAPITEACNGLDDDCDDLIDEGCDTDGDRYCEKGLFYALGPNGENPAACPLGPGDCNDDDNDIHPGASDLCDFVDNDCDDATDEDAPPVDAWPDVDLDGFGDMIAQSQPQCEITEGWSENADDCNDADPDIKPGVPDMCDLIDNDCDDATDEDEPPTDAWVDDDGDGFGDRTMEPQGRCEITEGWSANGDDCNDADPDIKPGVDEVCDGADNDCDDITDEEAVDRAQWYLDGDEDGVGAGEPVLGCEAPEGHVASSNDCDDTDPTSFPGAREVCGNGVDNDCDEQAPECRISGSEAVFDLTGTFIRDEADELGSGRSFATGDVVGDDGVPDLLVGSRDDGHIRVYPGPVVGALQDDDSTVRLVGPPGSEAGASVAVGDLTGDGALEVLIGAPGTNDNTGTIWWNSISQAGDIPLIGFFAINAFLSEDIGERVSVGHFRDGDGDGAWIGGRLNAYTFSGPLAQEATDLQTSDAIFDFGSNVTRPGHVFPGDVTGDGLDEFIVSWASSPDISARVAVFQSPVGGIIEGTGTAIATITGPDGSDQWGLTVVSGDVDGDGIDDLVVPDSGFGGANTGAVWVYRGPLQGNYAATDGLSFVGGTDTRLGTTVAVGDINGDGVDDLVMGCASYFGDSQNVFAHVVYGPITESRSLDALPDAVITAPPGFGFAQVAVGDLTGDGYDDVILRGWPLEPMETREGIWVVPGGPE